MSALPNRSASANGKGKSLAASAPALSASSASQPADAQSPVAQLQKHDDASGTESTGVAGSVAGSTDLNSGSEAPADGEAPSKHKKTRRAGKRQAEEKAKKLRRQQQEAAAAGAQPLIAPAQEHDDAEGSESTGVASVAASTDLIAGSDAPTQGEALAESEAPAEGEAPTESEAPAENEAPAMGDELAAVDAPAESDVSGEGERKLRRRGGKQKRAREERQQKRKEKEEAAAAAAATAGPATVSDTIPGPAPATSPGEPQTTTAASSDDATANDADVSRPETPAVADHQKTPIAALAPPNRPTATSEQSEHEQRATTPDAAPDTPHDDEAGEDVDEPETVVSSNKNATLEDRAVSQPTADASSEARQDLTGASRSSGRSSVQANEQQVPDNANTRRNPALEAHSTPAEGNGNTNPQSEHRGSTQPVQQNDGNRQSNPDDNQQPEEGNDTSDEPNRDDGQQPAGDDGDDGDDGDNKDNAENVTSTSWWQFFKDWFQFLFLDPYIIAEWVQWFHDLYNGLLALLAMAAWAALIFLAFHVLLVVAGMAVEFMHDPNAARQHYFSRDTWQGVFPKPISVATPLSQTIDASQFTGNGMVPTPTPTPTPPPQPTRLEPFDVTASSPVFPRLYWTSNNTRKVDEERMEKLAQGDWLVLPGKDNEVISVPLHIEQYNNTANKYISRRRYAYLYQGYGTSSEISAVLEKLGALQQLANPISTAYVIERNSVMDLSALSNGSERLTAAQWSVKDQAVEVYGLGHWLADALTETVARGKALSTMLEAMHDVSRELTLDFKGLRQAIVHNPAREDELMTKEVTRDLKKADSVGTWLATGRKRVDCEVAEWKAVRAQVVWSLRELRARAEDPDGHKDETKFRAVDYVNRWARGIQRRD